MAQAAGSPLLMYYCAGGEQLNSVWRPRIVSCTPTQRCSDHVEGGLEITQECQRFGGHVGG